MIDIGFDYKYFALINYLDNLSHRFEAKKNSDIILLVSLFTQKINSFSIILLPRLLSFSISSYHPTHNS